MAEIFGVDVVLFAEFSLRKTGGAEACDQLWPIVFFVGRLIKHSSLMHIIRYY